MAKLTHSNTTFTTLYQVEINISAGPERVWTLLTNAQDFPRWNSTVTKVEGQIRDGERLRLHVPDSDRVFTPVVSDVVPNERMTWTGGLAPVFRGVRTFALTARNDGSTDFRMLERFSGLLLPLIKRLLPDFGPIFERYAVDLKRESERASG